MIYQKHIRVQDVDLLWKVEELESKIRDLTAELEWRLNPPLF